MQPAAFELNYLPSHRLSPIRAGFGSDIMGAGRVWRTERALRTERNRRAEKTRRTRRAKRTRRVSRARSEKRDYES